MTSSPLAARRGTPPNPRRWESTFLAVLSKTGNASQAIIAAGTSRNNVYTARHRNTRFALAWASAMAEFHINRVAVEEGWCSDA